MGNTNIQNGRGYPYEEAVRTVSTRGDQTSPYNQPTLPNINLGDGNYSPSSPANNGNNGNNLALPTVYQKKLIRVVIVDCTNPFVDAPFNIPGTLIYFSGQFGGTAAPMKVRLDTFDNDRTTLIFDRAISGVPFKQFYLTNLVAQPGVTVELTCISDAPFDRVGLSG